MRKLQLIGASILTLATASTAHAQTDASVPSGGDIIVTAMKREQTLQDVPLSVAVTSAETIEKARIVDLIDLQSVVPSLRIVQYNASAQTLFVIRGFGNGTGNFGIESAVGVFIDGVYRSRSLSAIDDLPEIERVEVLRGPQSTLFGKNVSAGAISIITRKPQFEWGGSVEATFGNYNAMQGRATITGPLGEKVAVRLSGNFNLRDGIFENVTTGNDIGDRDRYGLRGDVLFEPTSELSIRIIADYNKINEACCGVTALYNGPATQFIGAAPPGGLGALIGDPDDRFGYKTVQSTDPVNLLEGKGISGQIDYDFGFARLTSITAYRNQLNESKEDVDFTGGDLVSRDDRVELDSFTQEIRLASTGDGPLQWLVGGFYQNESLDLGQNIFYESQLRAYADGLSGGAVSLLEQLQSYVNPGVIPGGTYFQPGQGLAIAFTQRQRAYSLFGQLDFKVTDKLTLTGGLAYMNDHKRVTQNIVMNDPFSALNLNNVPELPFLGVPANAFAGLGGLQFFYGGTPSRGPVNFPNATEDGVLADDKVSYALRAAYDFGIVNAYVNYSTGWKAGAFNLSSDSRPTNADGVGRFVRPENVVLYEAGLKSSFPGGFVNLAVFHQHISDFQVNAYVGTAYTLTNAGKLSVRGAELDAAYSPLPWLSWTGSITYLDPKYDSFKGAACVTFDNVNCPIDPLTGRRPLSRDLSGTRPAAISSWSFSTFATINHDFGNGLATFLRVEYDYASKVPVTEVAPPELVDYGNNLVNASLGLNFTDHNLGLNFWVRNLTDFHRVVGAFPSVGQDGSFTGYINQPRTFGVTARKSF